MSRSSTPSDSSVLALHDFTYDRDLHAIDYPHDHDESQPNTPLSPYTSRRSHARRYSLVDSQEATVERRTDHETGLLGGEVTAEDSPMDEFTFSEITLMAGSSFMVLALIGIAVTLTLGKVKL